MHVSHCIIISLRTLGTNSYGTKSLKTGQKRFGMIGFGSQSNGRGGTVSCPKYAERTTLGTLEEQAKDNL